MPPPLSVAPGSVVVVRDEEWLVTSVDSTADGQLLRVQGLSELVRGTNAGFYETLDTIQPLDPTQARLCADDSPGFRRARLWLESTIRKTPIPGFDTNLTVSTQCLANPLRYQQSAVRKALDPSNLRPRILLADAVGLGKTLEIGMILAELVRRGRCERILIICPRHVLEQMQHEMWTRFALPFVRLDSLGVQRVKQKLPATRNPFTYFKRVIISMDTLKQERFAHDLRRHHWDAVVIDESHNVTNVETQNNRLASIVAPNTDALILASATPHNGQKESFAELIRLLDPTAVTPHGDLDDQRIPQLVVRRHRHSGEVSQEVGNKWAERGEPNNRLVDAGPEENAVARELDETWLHPTTGDSPYSGANKLFGWTLAKAYLSSPAALAQTIAARIDRLGESDDPAAQRELAALSRLAELNDACLATPTAKYAALLDHLREIKVATDNRAVIFAERIATLHWLKERLEADLNLRDDQVVVMHGGLGDDEQQAIIESFKQATSPIRVLVTGDVASEGVNLHRQCHELIHFDIPWSLIRIEQRNGRIDRYGQEHPPRITTLLLNPDSARFSGDIRVLSRLLEKEKQAHEALGDAATLMGKYSATAEEAEIEKVLAGQRSFDEAIRPLDDAIDDDPVARFLATLAAIEEAGPAEPVGTPELSLYPTQVDYLRDALHEIYARPEAEPAANGVHWREHEGHGTVELVPPPDLRQRLEVLPQSYLNDRRVTERLTLATTALRGLQLLEDALSDESDSSWPQAHYLGPLHPVLEWAADRSLANLGRNEIFAVRGDVDQPTIALLGTLTNKRGQVVAASWLAVSFYGSFPVITPLESAYELLQQYPMSKHNPGPIPGLDRYQELVPAAVEAARKELQHTWDANSETVQERVSAWHRRAAHWQDEAEALVQRRAVTRQRGGVRAVAELIEEMNPDSRLVRPLLLIVPERGDDGSL